MHAAEQSPLFEMREVTVALGGRVILDRLNWKLEAGQAAVILGPSGSGKSIFLSTLLGFIQPASGAVTRPGGGGEDLFRQVSVLFQDDALLDDRTVEANLAIALLGRVDVWGGPFDGEVSGRIDAALRDVALDPDRVRRQFPAHLSGGMRRRVALARALLRRPRILVADEPTSGLDPETAESIFALMKQQIEAQGMSAVIITHDPLCARMLGNPSYRFTPGEGKFQPWEPGVGHRAEPPSSSDPGSSGGIAAGVVWSESGARWIDGMGWVALRLRDVAVLPPAGLLREGLVRWGAQSAGLVALIFFMSGLVVAVQAERAVVALGFSNRIPELFAVALTRTAPLLVGVLMAGRCGSAAAAQTGWRVLSSQHRALRTLGIDPDRSFFPPLAWSWMLAAPLLMVVGLASAVIAALVYLALPLSRARITPTFFLEDLPATISGATVAGMVAKCVLMAGGMAVIAYRSGAGAPRSSQDVTRGMTRALVASFIWLAAVDLVLGLLVAG